MMKSEDIRECNRLERNAKRLLKVVDILQKVYDENSIPDLDINYCQHKLIKARTVILAMRKKLYE